MNWYPRFINRAAADEALSCLPGYTDAEGNVTILPSGHGSGPGWHICHIGALPAVVEINELGVEVTVQTADSRHHVNIMATTVEADQLLKANLSPLCLTFPATPRRTWNGGQPDVEPDF